MTLGDAVAAVEATLDLAHLRVDRVRAREDAASYLLVVLDAGAGGPDEGPVANGPRLRPPAGSRRELASGGGRGSFL